MTPSLPRTDWTLSQLLDENALLEEERDGLARSLRNLSENGELLIAKAETLDEIIRRIRDDRADLNEVVAIIESRVGFFRTEASS